MRFISIAALLLLAAGCATFEEPSFEAKATGDPLPFLTVFELKRPAGSLEGEEGDTLSLLGKPEIFQDAFFQPMARDASALFRSVSVVQTASAGDLDQAKRVKADLLVRITPLKHDIVYDGRNGYALVNIGLWLLCWFPSWFVPDETWVADLEIEVSVTETAEGYEILKKNVKIRQEGNISDMGRGWNFLGTFLGPPCSDKNFRLASAHLHPWAAVALRKQVFQTLDTELRKAISNRGLQPAPDEPEKKGPAEPVWTDPTALVFGRNTGSSRFAEADASAFAGYLVSSGFDPKGVRLFRGTDATAEKLKECLEKMAEDEVGKKAKLVIYWAGPGCTVEEEGKGTPALGKPDDAILLTELVEKMKSFKDALLITDAGFGAYGEARSFSKGTPPAAPSGAWTKIASAAPVTILVSSSPGQPALETEERNAGFFTSSLLDGIKGDADMDGDDKVVLSELREYLLAQVPGFAGIMEKKPDPVMSGGKESRSLLGR
ncbi:MAG: caspase family protein, partial [Planctomycetota bacterium]